MYPGGTALFNLKQDISETTDVSSKHPEIVTELSALYDQWRSKMKSKGKKGKGQNSK